MLTLSFSFSCREKEPEGLGDSKDEEGRAGLYSSDF